MAKRRSHLTLFPLTFLSVLAHFGILFHNISPQNKADLKPHQFKITKIRTVGEEEGLDQKVVYLKSTPKKSKPQLKNLGIQQPNMFPEQDPKTAPIKKTLKSVSVDKKQVKKFLQEAPPGFLSPTQALSALSGTDVNIKLEVPKGIKEDELNKHELVFYSFQKRTALAYVSSFQRELNSFERKNPRLRFPLTQEKQKLAGRIIYDKNGDILKIQTLRWTDVEKLQSFFMDVLQNMSSLPNPPKEILEDDKFAINFILTLNN